MNTEDNKVKILFINLEKLKKAVTLVSATYDELAPFDATRAYSPKELEPYDALATRFERATEMAYKTFRSLELIEFAPYSGSVRDALLHMQKLRIIAEVSLWLEMRDIRNRIARDYLEEMLDSVYITVKNQYLRVLQETVQRIKGFVKKY